MKMLKQLIRLHKVLFMSAVFFTFLSVILNLCWNKYLAQLLDTLEKTDFFLKKETGILVLAGIILVFTHTISEFVSSYLSSCTCEMFAHELRMGYAKSYLQSDPQTLAGLNAGEEQSAMQNELTAISAYLQETLLFPLSIRDNITCGHPIADELVWAACESASLAEWIKDLPNGLDTHVGERGNQVSGGQAQRIQIARALCKDAPVILLDEPVSALDRDTGHSVLDALRQLTDGKTVIHVTHQQETLDDSYTIYRMEGGKIVRVCS